MPQLSLGVRGKRRRLNIAAIPDCEFWVDCARTETIQYSSGSNVTLVKDLSGKGRHLTKTGSGNDTIYPVYSAAERGVLFLNSAFDQMIAGTSGDWNFLHNGLGCTVLVLVKVDSAMAANGVLLATASESPGGIGCNLWYQNTNQNFQVTVRNGPSQTYLNACSNNTCPKGSNVILSYHMQNRSNTAYDLVCRSNGTTDLRMEGPLSTYSASNSTGALFVGKIPDSTWKCRMYFKKCAIFSRRISKAEENMILDSWAREENITLTRYAPQALAVISGQSNATGYAQIAQSSFASATSVTNALIFNNATCAFATLNAGANNQGHSSTQMGLEMMLGKTYTTLSGKPLYLVKYPIENQGITNWDPEDANFINLKSVMQRALWRMEDDGYTVKPFFIWYQGETDSQTQSEAEAYQTRLQSFIPNILGGLPAYAQAPTYVVQIHQDPVYDYTGVVQSAQMQACMTVPLSSYAHFVETADIAAHEDRSHLNATAQEALGDRIARRVLGV